MNNKKFIFTKILVTFIIVFTISDAYAQTSLTKTTNFNRDNLENQNKMITLLQDIKAEMIKSNQLQADFIELYKKSTGKVEYNKETR